MRVAPSAPQMGHLEMVRCLLRARAKVDITSRYGRTPLQLASLQGHLSCLELLLEHRAHVDKGSLAISERI